MPAVWVSRFLRSKNLQLKNGMDTAIPGVLLRKTPKDQKGVGAFLVRARDRSGIFAPEGQKVERIARFFAVRGTAKNAPKSR
jgi:hypothetical protein